MIRTAKISDIARLVDIDSAAYGSYGADRGYFEEKFASDNVGILVVEEAGDVSGFCVFEILRSNQIPPDFCDLKLRKPLEDTWTHIIAFTTSTNYIDLESDGQLVRAVEEKAKIMGSDIFCVPLSVEHPFEKNDVFGFWKKNGYERAGTIKWKASSNELIECYFYCKLGAR